MSEGEKVWTPGLFGDDYYGSYSEGSSVVPGVSGMYRWVISPRWYLNGEWEYTYSRNKSATWDKTGETSAIDNGTSESVNSFNFKITPAFFLSPKFTFNYVLTGDFTSYSTDYSGFTTASCVQHRQDIDNNLGFWWNITNSLNVYVSPRLSISLWQIEEVKEKQINPSVSAGCGWSADSKLNLNGEVQYNRYSANPNKLNPVLVRSSELMWLKGNPYLHNLDMWSGYLGINYLPFNRLSFSMHNSYSRTNGGTLFEYSPMDAENGGLLKTAYNTSSSDIFSSTLGVNTSFFNRKLTLHLQGSYNYTNESLTRADMHTFNWSADASYTFGNVRLTLNYRSPMKSLSNGGRQTTRISSHFDASLIYGWKNFYMDVTIINIFHKYSKQSVVYQSPHYSFSRENLSVGRVIGINLTYTFGYGKEIDPRIDASIPDAKTNVLHYNSLSE
ncbi:MAG: outer membrane beta-barrel family protein [Muribaculaceae bacterium]|nr:outer membrane beta-barrel family protein [Muribaculaceae bacterium]